VRKVRARGEESGVKRRIELGWKERRVRATRVRMLVV